MEHDILNRNAILPIAESKNSFRTFIGQYVLMDRIMQKKKEEQDKICNFEWIMVGKSVEECHQIFKDSGITNDICIVTIGGKPVDGKYVKGNKNSINVDVNNINDKIITKVIKIGK